MIQIKARNADKQDLGKALIEDNGCSLIKCRNAELDHFGSSLWAALCRLIRVRLS